MSLWRRLYHIWFVWPVERNGDAWIIEIGGKFWDGKKFKKNRSAAVRYRSRQQAWDFIEDQFAEHLWEDFSLHFVKDATSP